ncbi:MAG TPA: FMN-binding glutamate synthase family protein, partial [Chiayiivirga sp.]|nr:FMN-binding glutamate synthase family protein [Chiayiivirga sp.]
MSRYTAYAASIVLALVLLALALRFPQAWWGVAVFAGLALLGTLDMLQRKSTLRRNYPLLAHFRYGLETIGPEIRQYFIQAATDKVPFSREQRALVYQRAKHVNDVRPFGTLRNVYDTDYEWINHSIAPTEVADHDFRITIGAGTRQPYSASVFNISAMSFGALSAAAIRALNGGAKRGGFYHDTGEGSISPYHREGGGDLVWELGSGYFGCRNHDGSFNEKRFAEQAADPQVKMIEIKLSQGAKPGHGGVLPAAKVSPEIAATRD